MTYYSDDHMSLIKEADNNIIFTLYGTAYKLSSHPYEPCLYIGDTITVHDSFDLTSVVEDFDNNQPTILKGNTYTPKEFCKFLANEVHPHIEELKKKLNDWGISNTFYSLMTGELPNECLCLILNESGDWETYYSEKGQKTGVKLFSTEAEACEYVSKNLSKYSNNPEEFIICPLSNPLYTEITAISTSKGGCLTALLKYMLKKGIDVQVLKKTACGNSHDENWQNLYTVVGGASQYTDMLADIKNETGGLYVDKSIIETVDSLDDDTITEWAKPFEYYSGEERERYIYAVVEGQRCVYRVREEFPHSPTLSDYDEYRNLRSGLKPSIRVVMAKRTETEMTLEDRAKLKQRIVRETGRKSAIKSKKGM